MPRDWRRPGVWLGRRVRTDHRASPPVSGGCGVAHVTFEQADAEFHHFPVERFQVAISRFGAMWAFPSITGNGTRVNHADQSIRDQRERRHGGALRV
jgi:hypothetical protein